MKQVYKFLLNTKSLLLFVHKLDSRILGTYISISIVKAIIPYVYIIGGALIIDSLIQTNYDMAMVQALVMIIINLLMQLLFHYIAKYRMLKGMAISRLCNMQIIMKSISLDYATFENKKNLEEFNAADYNVAKNGGFGFFLEKFGNLIEGIISLIIATTLLIKLCLIESDRIYAFSSLISKEGSLITFTAIVVILLCTYLKLLKYVNENNLKIFTQGVRVNQKYGFFNNQLFMNENYAKEIRLYNMKGFIFDKWKLLSFENFDFEKRRWKFTQTSLIVNMIANDVVVLLAYLFVSLKTIAGAISIGSFTQYVGVVGQFNMSLRNTIEAIKELQIRHSYLMFYIDYMSKDNLLNTGTKKINENINYEVEFHNVSFKYPNTSEYIINDLSCKFELHDKYAIVGRNGAGKTTFIKLLCRLYEVSEGKITLNGIDIREYDYDEYLKMFSVVFQDFVLFSMSLRDNIAGINNVNEAKVWEYLDSAGVKEKIASMPAGLDTLLYNNMGAGVDVSGGQAQKIAIARALYKDAQFVVLDEPTAALDPISEYEIYQSFNDMVKDKTSIYISHRMSSCKFCDHILVFDKGQIIQRGTHDQLVRGDGVYKTLWDAQSKYYN